LYRALAERSGAGGDTRPEASCHADLARYYAARGAGLADIHAAAQVPDDYLTHRRVLGLYPLTALPVRLGVSDLQAATRQSFALPLDELPREGELLRYVPSAGRAAGVRRGVPAAAIDALGVRLSLISETALDDLLARHAPILEIDTTGPFDRPGAPFIDGEGRGRVGPGEAIVHRYAREMSFAGRMRLQLVYVVWFSERPSSGFFDTLAGPVDGLVWRVTLDDSGQALVYDSIHPCGCYHQFFPGPTLSLRPGAQDTPEPPLLPQDAPQVGEGERVLLRVASGSHYLQRVGVATTEEEAAAASYTMRSYAALYSLEAPAGVESFFGDHGLVPGTQRGERFYLWPMGVRSPGAMRERGRQATAFLGRRHFDDAGLLDRVFVLDKETP
jgi:hypothetical protein